MKKTMMLAFVCALLFSATALAETKTIDVTTDDITIMVDGKEINITDSYGAAAEPFIYNGQVYVPLDNLADVLNKSYQWDGASKTAYMGVAPGEKQYMVDVNMPYEYDDDNVKFYTLGNGKSFSMANQSYTNGMSMGLPYYAKHESYALFNLNGEYETMTMKVGHIDGTPMYDGVLSVYLDGKLAQEIKVKAEELPQNVVIPLNHALSMKLTFVETTKRYDGTVKMVYGLADMILE